MKKSAMIWIGMLFLIIVSGIIWFSQTNSIINKNNIRAAENGKAAQKPRSSAAKMKIQELAWDAQFHAAGNTRREEIKRIFGDPKQVIVGKATTDGTFRRFNYDGLYYIVFKNELIEQVSLLSVTSDKYRMKFGLSIGVSKASVVRELGAPDFQGNGRLTYQYETESSIDLISFYFKGNKIVKIEWALGQV